MELYLITPPEADFLDTLASLPIETIDWLQYRRPGYDDADRYEELAKLQSILDGSSTKIIVNDRPDLAVALETFGVHLGEVDLPVAEVKNSWPQLTVGYTQRVETPINETADYLSVGPVFESRTKNLKTKTTGWDGVSQVLEKASQPVYAIGGLTPERLASAPSGLAGVAVISAVWNRSDPKKAVRALRDAIDGNRSG